MKTLRKHLAVSTMMACLPALATPAPQRQVTSAELPFRVEETRQMRRKRERLEAKRWSQVVKANAG